MVLTNVETSIRSARIPQTNRYRNEKDSIWSPLPHQVISSGFIVKPQTYRYRNETVSGHLYHIRLYLVASLSNLRLIDIEMRQYLITFTTSGYI
jgi:hypothetical protein